MVDEVDDKTLDVGAILILISHHHQLPIAKGLQLARVSVLLAVLETKYLHHIADLLIAHDLNIAMGKKIALMVKIASNKVIDFAKKKANK